MRLAYSKGRGINFYSLQQPEIPFSFIIAILKEDEQDIQLNANCHTVHLRAPCLLLVPTGCY